MLIGQMSFKTLSTNADFLQLDICGLSPQEALSRYLGYNYPIPIIIHGDWSKKGFSEDNLALRYIDYIQIIQSLSLITKVLGITIHPPSRKCMDIKKVCEICNTISKYTNVPVFIENRSNKNLNLSLPNEITEFSKNHFMTLDIPQLYISCGYDMTKLLKTISQLNLNNIKEIHIANILRRGTHTFVARKLDDGDIDIIKILSLLPSKAFYTLEILGGTNVFNNSKLLLFDYIKESSLFKK